MGHRAYVAYRRADGRFDCHHSQWGALHLRLLEEITSSAPYGRPPDDPPVESTPRETVESLSALATSLNYRTYEAVYTVSRSMALESYVPLWLGLQLSVASGELESPLAGVLVPVDSRRDAGRVRQWFRSLKARVGRLVERDDLSESHARGYLRTRAASRWNGDLYWSDSPRRRE